jgi:hypothetical protein
MHIKRKASQRYIEVCSSGCLTYLICRQYHGCLSQEELVLEKALFRASHAGNCTLGYCLRSPLPLAYCCNDNAQLILDTSAQLALHLLLLSLWPPM